jgi:hypothetical protein
MTVIGTAEVYIVGKDMLTPDLKRGATELTKDVGDGAEKAGGRAHAAFKKAFGSLSTAFGPALGPLQEVFDKFEGIGEAASDMRSKAGKALLAMGGTATIVGAALQGWGDKDKIAQKQLQQAIENTGGSWDEYHEKTEEVIKSGEHYGHTAQDTQSALKNIVTKTNDAKGAYASMSLVTDLAATKHISLSQASDVVAKIMNGNTRIMKQYGISQDQVAAAAETSTHKHARLNETLLNNRKDQELNKQELIKHRIAQEQEIIATTKDKAAKEDAKAAIRKYRNEIADSRDAVKGINDKLKDNKEVLKESVDKHKQAKEALDILSGRMKGQAAIAADTFTGKLQSIKAKTEDVVAQVGQKFGPALTTAGPVMMGFGAIMELGIAEKLKNAKTAISEFNAVEKISQGIKKIGMGINYALGASETAALGPIILIVAAIGLLVAAFIYAYKHIGPFHDLVNKVAHTLKTVFIGAFHAAQKAFNVFVDAFDKVWDTVRNIIKKYGVLILAVIAPFIGLPLLIMQHWDDIKDFFTKVFRNVSDAASKMADKVVGFFSGLKGRITKVFTGGLTWLYNMGRDIVQGLLNGAGALLSTIGDFFLSKVPGVLKGPLKKALGIHSPSTVFAGYGRNIMEGLMQGLESHQGSVSATMTRIMGSLTPGGGWQPAAAVASSGGSGRTINLFPNSSVDMSRTADADAIVQRLTTMVSGSRL